MTARREAAWEAAMDALAAMVAWCEAPSGRARPGKRLLRDAALALYSALGHAGLEEPQALRFLVEEGRTLEGHPEVRRKVREAKGALERLAWRSPAHARLLRGMVQGFLKEVDDGPGGGPGA